MTVKEEAKMFFNSGARSLITSVAYELKKQVKKKETKLKTLEFIVSPAVQIILKDYGIPKAYFYSVDKNQILGIDVREYEMLTGLTLLLEFKA